MIPVRMNATSGGTFIRLKMSPTTSAIEKMIRISVSNSIATGTPCIDVIFVQ
jgi:hypothetical protein